MGNHNVARYQQVSRPKATGATWTPKILSDFVAREMYAAAHFIEDRDALQILDPAVGDGQLLDSLLACLPPHRHATTHVYGVDTDPTSVQTAAAVLSAKYPTVSLHLQVDDFLSRDLLPLQFDLIIANPPYVRTQILGAEKAKQLASAFELSGRIDLYQAFVIAMSRVLHPSGVAGIILSNRFMTTRSGAVTRRSLQHRYSLMKLWDLGDTRLFKANVLPAVLIAGGVDVAVVDPPLFTSVYHCSDPPLQSAPDVIAALNRTGSISLDNGSLVRVEKGFLDSGPQKDGVWRLSTRATDTWLAAVNHRTWMTFGDIGTVRVGVKTTADRVFVRSDWEEKTDGKLPELLCPLTTHHVARPFRAAAPTANIRILYPYETVNGRRKPVDLSLYPHSENYLLQYRERLESRHYLRSAGRNWYELWVPQDPAAWKAPRLVFRDIAQNPICWMDESGSVVNGDCYWLTTREDRAELLWLAAAVVNSTFMKRYYDIRFSNRLYGGRRRFMSQYIRTFPLPNPTTPEAKRMIQLCQSVYEKIDGEDTSLITASLDALVWKAFGVESPGEEKSVDKRCDKTEW